MDTRTLAAAMGCSTATAQTYVVDVNRALAQAGCTTVNRAAMWCAQVGHESAGLRYMEEIASGAAYEGRRDLGNTQPGDGRRFKGRGPIQLTGRNNYARFGQWCRDNGLVSDANYFVNNPAVVATSRWGFLAASWYWVVARSNLNALADAGDITAATRAVNGGINGLADRIVRWNRCRALGNALLPVGGGGSTPVVTNNSLMEDTVQLRAGNRSASISCKGAREMVVSSAYGNLKIIQVTFWGPYGTAGDKNFLGEFKPSNGLVTDHYPWVVRVPANALSCSIWWELANDSHEASVQFL